MDFEPATLNRLMVIFRRVAGHDMGSVPVLRLFSGASSRFGPFCALYRKNAVKLRRPEVEGVLCVITHSMNTLPLTKTLKIPFLNLNNVKAEEFLRLSEENCRLANEILTFGLKDRRRLTSQDFSTSPLNSSFVNQTIRNVLGHKNARMFKRMPLETNNQNWAWFWSETPGAWSFGLAGGPGNEAPWPSTADRTPNGFKPFGTDGPPRALSSCTALAKGSGTPVFLRPWRFHARKGRGGGSALTGDRTSPPLPSPPTVRSCFSGPAGSRLSASNTSAPGAPSRKRESARPWPHGKTESRSYQPLSQQTDCRPGRQESGRNPARRPLRDPDGVPAAAGDDIRSGAEPGRLAVLPARAVCRVQGPGRRRAGDLRPGGVHVEDVPEVPPVRKAGQTCLFLHLLRVQGARGRRRSVQRPGLGRGFRPATGLRHPWVLSGDS